MRLTVRPITLWPGKLRTDRERIRSTFDVKSKRVLTDLQREIEHLSGREAYAVIEFACTEADIRLDGWLYANARLQHPGVILNIESKHGPLRLWTDRYETWEDGNLRAISLYLAHQRAAERYGLGRGDETFVGWKAIGPKSIELGPGPGTMTYEMAINYIATISGKEPTYVENYANACFRVAAAKHHPDVNPDPASEAIYRQLVEARDIITKTRETR